MKKFHNIWRKGICAVGTLLAVGVIMAQSSFVSLAYPESGVINAPDVNIRSTADTGSTDNVMRKSEENMEVSVLGEETGSDGNTWLKVSYTENGQELIGYIRSDYVTMSGSTGTDTTEEAGTEGTQTEGTQAEGTVAAGEVDTQKNPYGLTPIEGLNDDLTCYVDIDQSHFYINQGFTDDMIPDGFYRTEVDYRGNSIQAVCSRDIENSGTGNDFYLVYLTDYDSQSTSDWYVYDADAQGFCYWIKLETMQGKYLYMLDTFGGAQMDFGYEEKTLEVQGKQIQAWQLILSEEEDLTGENSYFYYVYGINQDGNKGLYSYYTLDETYQRNVLTGLEIVDDEYLSTEENTKLLESQLKELNSNYNHDMSRRFTIICVLIVICVLLLFVVIHLALRVRRMSEDYDDDDEDDEDEEENGRPEPRKGLNGSGLKGRSLKKAEEPEDLDAAEDTDVTEVPDSTREEDVLNDISVEDISLEDIDITPEDIEEFKSERIPVTAFDDADEEDGDNGSEDDDDEDEDEDDYEEVKPKRHGFFFGRRRDEDDEDEDEEDDEDDDEDEDDYEEVKPKHRGFFFGRRRDEDDEDEEEDSYEDDEDEEPVSWAESRRAAREAKTREKEEEQKRRMRAKAEADERRNARRSRYEDDDEEEDAYVRSANKKSRAADYAEKTVSERKSSRAPEPVFDDDDDFEMEFIDLDDDL